MKKLLCPCCGHDLEIGIGVAMTAPAYIKNGQLAFREQDLVVMETKPESYVLDCAQCSEFGYWQRRELGNSEIPELIRGTDNGGEIGRAFDASDFVLPLPNTDGLVTPSREDLELIPAKYAGESTAFKEGWKKAQQAHRKNPDDWRDALAIILRNRQAVHRDTDEDLGVKAYISDNKRREI